MTIQGWDPPVIAAVARLGTITAALQPGDGARPEDLGLLEQAAAVIYTAVDERMTSDPNPALAEVRLLAGSLVMALRHGAIASVSLADTVDRLSDLIGG